MMTAQLNIRQLSFDIEISGLELKILLETIVEKLDGIETPVSGDVLDTINAVNCFVSCAMRSVGDLMTTNGKILSESGKVAA